MNNPKTRSDTFKKLVLTIAKPIVKLMLNVKVSGIENIPSDGPGLLAANHFSWWEPPSMVLASPRPINFIAANDFKWDMRIAWLVKLYGSIPVDRRVADKRTIQLALKTLKQKRLVAIFPQGGMMHQELSEPKLGVMFLAHRANVPIIPIGISGQVNPAKYWKKLKRPEITVKIGKPFHLKELPAKWQDQKIFMKESGNDLMCHIAALVDKKDRGIYADDPRVEKYIKANLK